MSKFEILKDGSLSVEDAKIIWTNFTGRPTKYNLAGGKRTFSLVLDEDTANTLMNDGWNVRKLDSRDPQAEPTFVTEIIVAFGEFPPKIYVVNDITNVMERQTEDTIACLDGMDIANVDVLIRPYHHGIANSRGTNVKGYVKSLYVTQDNSDFNGKYANHVIKRNDDPDCDE